MHRSAARSYPVVAALLLLSAACKQVSKPPPRVPGDLPATFSRSGEAELPDRWWRTFEDERLNQLVSAGLADNPGLRAVWARRERAAAAFDRADAERYPELEYFGSLGVEESEADDGGSGGEERFGLGLVASYEVDLWGRVEAQVREAEFTYHATAADVRAAAITLSAAIAETWYLMAEQAARIELIRSQIETNGQLLEILRSRFRRGQSSAEDVLRQRQLVETRRGELALAEGGFALLQHRLAILLGRPPAADAETQPGALVELPPLPSTGIPLELLRRRPDLVARWLRIEASHARVAQAMADTYPRVSLSATAETLSDDIGELFDTWQAALVANIVGPLLDAGRREAEIEVAKAEAREVFHLYREDLLGALGEVEDALVEERRQEAFTRSLERQVALSGQVIEQARTNYRNGVSDYVGVLDALRTHQTLERDVLQARLDRIRFRIALCRALAGGWSMTAPEVPETPAEPAMDETEKSTA